LDAVEIKTEPILNGVDIASTGTRFGAQCCDDLNVDEVNDLFDGCESGWLRSFFVDVEDSSKDVFSQQRNKIEKERRIFSSALKFGKMISFLSLP